jgi:hypothetical protein
MDRTADLLADFARLLKRYGPEEFERLARLIDSSEWRQAMMQLLEAGAREGRRIARASHEKMPAKRQPSESSLETTRRLEPERYAVLSEIAASLQRARSPELRDLLERLGVVPSGRSRKGQIENAMRSLASRSLPQLREVSSSLSRDEGGLRGWSNIIMPKGGANK